VSVEIPRCAVCKILLKNPDQGIRSRDFPPPPVGRVFI
jgi:hypothetical protein